MNKTKEDLIVEGNKASEDLHNYFQKMVSVAYKKDGKNKTTRVYRMGVTHIYEIFEFVKENREVGKHRKLEEALEASGFLPHFHIIVAHNKKTKKLEVIDGQHRLTIAMEKGYPVSYWVVDDPDENAIPRANTTQKKWPQVEYMKYWLEKGHGEYEKLLAFYNESKIPLSMCISLLAFGSVNRGSNGVAASSVREFELGEFKVNPDAKQHAEDLGTVAGFTAPRFREARQRPFLSSMSSVLKAFPDFDLEHWVTQVDSNGFSKHMTPTTSIDGMVRNISNVYDYRRHNKVDIYGMWVLWDRSRRQKLGILTEDA